MSQKVQFYIMSHDRIDLIKKETFHLKNSFSTLVHIYSIETVNVSLKQTKYEYN